MKNISSNKELATTCLIMGKSYSQYCIYASQRGWKEMTEREYINLSKDTES